MTDHNNLIHAVAQATLPKNASPQSIRPGALSTARNSITECALCNDRELVVKEKDGVVWAEPCSCKEQKRQKRLLKTCGLSPFEREVRLKHFEVTPATLPMFALVEQYLGEFPQIFQSSAPNKGFGLSGTLGIGKSMLVIAAANQLLDAQVGVVFVRTPELISKLRQAQFTDGGRELEEMISLLAGAEVVVLDDVAREKVTGWVQDQYFRVVDARYRRRAPTLFTSNYDWDGMARKLGDGGDAIVSRLYEMTRGRHEYVEAADYRTRGLVGREGAR